MKTPITSQRAAILTVTVLLYTSTAWATVFGYGLDTSGSMQGKRFEAARAALIRELDSLRPGDVALVFSFDVVARPLGRISVAEDGTAEGREELVRTINAVKPRGLWTNLDEIINRLKLAVLEERTLGDRVLAVISDGLTDPDQYHQRVDIAALGKMVPQQLGVSLYLISLSEDLTRLFGQEPDPASGTVASAELPHITGVAFDQSSPSSLVQALEKVHNPTRTPADTATMTAAPTASATPTVRPAATSTARPSATRTATPSPFAATREPASPLPLLPWIIGSLLLAGIGASVPLLRRSRQAPVRNLILEVAEGSAPPKQVPLTLRERDKITVGPGGDVTLSDPDLPAVVFTLVSERGQLWLTPLDAVSVNAAPVTRRTAVGIGDVITVRDTTTIRIDEGASE